MTCVQLSESYPLISWQRKASVKNVSPCWCGFKSPTLSSTAILCLSRNFQVWFTQLCVARVSYQWKGFVSSEPPMPISTLVASKLIQRSCPVCVCEWVSCRSNLRCKIPVSTWRFGIASPWYWSGAYTMALGRCHCMPSALRPLIRIGDVSALFLGECHCWCSIE